MNELINDEAVYRTAPATPGLLIITTDLHLALSQLRPKKKKKKREKRRKNLACILRPPP